MVDPLIVKTKKFTSRAFKGTYNKSGDCLQPDYEEESGVLEYLRSICICNPLYTDDHPNFFDGEVLAHVNYYKINIGN